VAYAFGGDWFEKAGYESGYPKTFLFEPQAVVDATQFLADVILRHGVQPTPEQAQAIAPPGMPAFLSGRLGMQAASASNLATYKPAGFDWGVAAKPAPPAPPGFPRREYLYTNQWASFKGVNDPALAWELLKHMASPPMMRLFPLSTGRFPSRRSMLPLWQDFQKREYGRSDADLKAISDAMDHQWVSASFRVVEFGDLYLNILQPQLNRVFAGEVTARQAMEAMTPLVLDYLRSTAR
jgi:ABC-type glycerol-3-phosphate transport system substrate-binding protein